jgi:cytokinin dehydrogenase
MQMYRRDLLKYAGGALAYIAGGQLVFADKVSAAIQKRSLANRLAEDLPEFEGVFAVDEGVCYAMGTDFGHFVHNRPIGVLFPKSAYDVQAMVQYANAKDIKVAFRGTGGAAYGQSQVLNGIVIDSSSMTDISWSGHHTLDVGPGAIWHDILTVALTRKMTPPVLPDTVFISAGGTLNAGGMGETSYRYGGQIDQVAELDVVTGAGDLVTCSPRYNSHLYHSGPWRYGTMRIHHARADKRRQNSGKRGGSRVQLHRPRAVPR